MKKITKYLSVAMTAFALSFMAFAAPVTSAADGGGNGIKVSPVRSEVTITPGDSKVISVYVTNVTDAAAEFRAITNDFVPQGEEGQPALVLNDNEYAPSHSLKRYMLDLPNVTLGSNETKEVKVTISIPRDAAGGGYYGAVRFAPAAVGSNDKNVSLSASVGSIILVKVPGEIKNDLTMESFDVRKGAKGVGGSAFFTSNKDLYVTSRFKNKGNVHEQPFGKVQLKQGDKVLYSTEINDTDPKGNVLPDSIRRFDTKLDRVPSFGKFTVQGSFGYGEHGQLVNASTTFWVVPVPFIVGAVLLAVLIAAAIILIPRAIKRHDAKVVRASKRR